MAESSLHQTYSDRVDSFSQKLKAITNRIDGISNLRIALAVLFIGAVYVAIAVDQRLSAIAALLIVVFLYVIRIHANLFRKKTYFENLVKINRDEVLALDGNVDAMDPGTGYIDPHHPYSHDLDIFGDGSLYQFVNRCNTTGGKQMFAARLASPPPSAAHIKAQQQAIQDLEDRLDFRQDLQAAGLSSGEKPEDRQQLLRWAQQPSLFANERRVQILITILPALTICALVATFLASEARFVLIPLILTQWIVTGLHLKKINVYHDFISRKKNVLEKYSDLLYCMEKETFHSNILQEISARAKNAHGEVRHLASLVSALDARTNSMTAAVVNSLLLYDLQCVFRLERWKQKNAEYFEGWLSAIDSAESLSSFATFGFNNRDFNYASVHNELMIGARAMAHPLIAKEERVVNDFTIGPDLSVMIVTGANMAGKSTFLRTIGVNTILALNGARVCAESFTLPVIAVRSGMRTADSLKDHQSYFFAELNRLKSIMDELRRDTPILVLLDEILKGTNSNDKLAGSVALVRQLLPHPCLAVIATHDLALAALEQEFPERIRNFSFEATIVDDTLSFDYRLKRGVAQRMNASFLMRKMGIIP